MKGHVIISVGKSVNFLPDNANSAFRKSSHWFMVPSGLMLYSDPFTISIGGITLCNALAIADLAVPFPPAMTRPPMFGLTARRIRPVFIISCPTISDSGISNLVFDSDVNCREGEDIAFFIFSGSMPRKFTEGLFKASTDSVPFLLSMITAGDTVGSIAAER